MDNEIRFILVNGYGWTGSSIVIDLLSEYKNVYALKHEFRIIKDPHGIADLDHVLNSRTDQLNVDTAIKEFLNLMDVYFRRGGHFGPPAGGLEIEFGKAIYAYTKEYISEITDKVYKGYWHYADFFDSAFSYFIKRVSRKINENAFYTDMRVSVADEDRFLKATKKYINKLFYNIIEKENIDTIVLDQAIHPMHLNMASRYFDNYCTIVVDRDPRDVYVNLVKRRALVGYDSSITHDPSLFITWYKAQHNCEQENLNALYLKFEDIVLYPKEVTKKIAKYCGLNERDHEAVGSLFVPEKSKKNIRIYKEYVSKEEIRMIEENLEEYLYKE